MSKWLGGLGIVHNRVVTTSVDSAALIPQSALGWWGTREGIEERTVRL